MSRRDGASGLRKPKSRAQRRRYARIRDARNQRRDERETRAASWEDKLRARDSQVRLAIEEAYEAAKLALPVVEKEEAA